MDSCITDLCKLLSVSVQLNMTYWVHHASKYMVYVNRRGWLWISWSHFMLAEVESFGNSVACSELSLRYLFPVQDFFFGREEFNDLHVPIPPVVCIFLDQVTCERPR